MPDRSTPDRRTPPVARMISYAQNFEDVMLARCFAGQTTGLYVDVGAAGPVTDSVTKHFYDLGWSGINVEPVKLSFAELVHERPRDVNLCVGVGRERGVLTMVDFSHQGVSTFDRGYAQHFIDRGFRFAERTVDVLSLREVCEAHTASRRIDFLKIDVEGWERPVLEGGDWKRFRPRVVLVEATRPNSNEPAWDWEPLLLASGYLFAYFDGLNRFYVAEEDRTLLDHFRVPPNVNDGFEAYATAYFRQALTPAGFVPYLVRGITRAILRAVR